jgi:flagellar hook assembly protein FlgD
MEKIVLEIYNVRGQLVRTLLNGSQEFSAGSHSVVWNGTDDFGRSMSSGIYFYRIQTSEQTATRRMLLMK